MNLIYYRGLNCHLASIINIAANLGINYPNAFSTLWSEKDFKNDLEYHMYTSKRVYTNLELLGLKSDVIDCTLSKAAVADGLSVIHENELLLIGMDTFYIPWSKVFQNFHEAHYFFVQKDTADTYYGFDPTYDKKYMPLQADYISDHAFDIIRFSKGKEKGMKVDLYQEAKEVLYTHPEMKEAICFDIQKCKDRLEDVFNSLIQLITAMINNRYLFLQYLQSSFCSSDYHRQFFNKEFFSKWEGVKNGLYKAYILKNKENVVAEVSSLFLNVVEEEIMIAKKILKLELDKTSL